ncbi:MAG: glutamine--tRNA ligase/YqeY domain fusion protein [Pseudohongiellaceae bacterium]
MTGSSHKDSPSGTATPSNFIRQLIARDLASGKHGGRVHTRFPPEPNGYLHIGHAKSICLNFGLAEENGGQCNLRFDDTNPAKESQEYVDAIKDNIRWLGFKWAGEVRYSSDYFDELYAFAEQLIEKGLAYVDELSPEQAREYRGTLTEPGKNSPHRDRPASENMDLFRRMRAGEFADGKLSLRAKIDMASPNMNMRDPVLYRIRHISHHQTGDKWCIYPTYDYTHCICDALENITHSLCTLEFEDHRPLYDWILQHLDLKSLQQAGDTSPDSYVLPEQTEFAKLKLNYTIMGKRKLKEMVEEGIVTGWDDPRMPTLAGLRRRGYTANAIRNFCESVGVSRSESTVDMSMLEFAIRNDLDKHAPRVMCVLRPLKVVLENIDNSEHLLKLPSYPKNPKLGERTIPLTQEIFIDQTDFSESPPPGFKRLVEGGEVRLRGAYVIKCNKVIKDGAGRITELHCTADLETLGRNPAGRKVKGVIHWVSAKKHTPVGVRLYDRLFNVKNPENKEIENYRQCLNPDSFVSLKHCVLEYSASEAIFEVWKNLNNQKKTMEPLIFQFEREGYFCLDTTDPSYQGNPVFNRTITLRDSWGRN